MDLVGLKVKSMFALSDRVHATDTLLAELLVHEDVERIEELADLIGTEIEAEHQLMAFETPSGITDWDKWLASTYHDQLDAVADDVELNEDDIPSHYEI